MKSRERTPSRRSVEPPRFITEDEFARVAAYLPQTFVAACMVMLDVGVRNLELLDLERERVDLDLGLLELVDPSSPTGGRTVPLTKRCRAELAYLLAQPGHDEFIFANPDTGLPVRSMEVAFSAACHSAGLPKLWLRDLCYSYAVNATAAGVPAALIEKRSGVDPRNICHDHVQLAASLQGSRKMRGRTP